MRIEKNTKSDMNTAISNNDNNEIYFKGKQNVDGHSDIFTFACKFLSQTGDVHVLRCTILLKDGVFLFFSGLSALG